MKRLLPQILLILIPALVLLILGVFILQIGSVGSFFSGVFFIATAMNEHAGLNIWLARAIAAPLVFAAYFYGIRFILFQRQKQILGWACLVGLWSVVCLSMFFMQGSFSRTTGKALKFYFKDERGRIVMRDHSGVDADTGKKLQAVTPEIVRLYDLQQRGILEISDETLFDPSSGAPLKRYYKGPDGTIELFPLEVKFHPEIGDPLQIITKDVAEQLKRQHKASLGRKLKQSFAGLPESFKGVWSKLRTLEAELIAAIVKMPVLSVQLDPSSKDWVELYRNSGSAPLRVQVKAEGEVKQGEWSIHGPYNSTWKYGWELMPGEKLGEVPGPRDKAYAYMPILSIHSGAKAFVAPSNAPRGVSGADIPVLDGKFIPLLEMLTVTLQPGQQLKVIWNDTFTGMKDNQGTLTFTLSVTPGAS